MQLRWTRLPAGGGRVRPLINRERRYARQSQRGPLRHPPRPTLLFHREAAMKLSLLDWFDARRDDDSESSDGSSQIDLTRDIERGWPIHPSDK